MGPREYAYHLLEGTKIEDKLLSPCALDFDSKESFRFLQYKMPSNPGRSSSISFSGIQLKFPKKNQLHIQDKRATALHFFANHELLAIEMMAAALLCLPVPAEDEKKVFTTLINTIEDEQKHFKLYISRMKEFGMEFGDLPVNDFFWRQMFKLSTFKEFYALMAITFEGANLDFTSYYAQAFREVEDYNTADIINIVLEDEIKHVAFGHSWLQIWKKRQLNSPDKFWDYYTSLLPETITPARAKGNIFCEEYRRRAGMESDFIAKLKNFRGDFSVTKRKQWE